MGEVKFKKRLLVFLVPALAVYLCFFILPFVLTISYSLCNWDGIMEPVFVGFANFKAVFQDKVFIDSVGRVVKWAFLAALIQPFMGLFIANLLHGKVAGSGIFRSLYFLPVVISSAAVCVMFTVIYDNDIGLINGFLRLVGLSDWAHIWLGDVKVVFYACIAVPIWQSMGMFIVVMFSGLQSVSGELIEAAKIDGANSAQLFLKIIIPLMMPIIQICVVLSISNSFKNFDYIYMLTGGGPMNSTQVPATLMYARAFAGRKYGLGTAIAIVIVLLSSITVTIVKRIFKYLEER